MNNILIAFLLTLFAGLATGIGSLIALLAKTTNKKFLSVSLGLSAGVMIYVSMVELFADAKNSLILALGEKKGSYITVIAFFAGMFLIALIDKLVPSEENPHEVKEVLNDCQTDECRRIRKKMIEKVNENRSINSPCNRNT